MSSRYSVLQKRNSDSSIRTSSASFYGVDRSGICHCSKSSLMRHQLLSLSLSQKTTPRLMRQIWYVNRGSTFLLFASFSGGVPLTKSAIEICLGSTCSKFLLEEIIANSPLTDRAWVTMSSLCKSNPCGDFGLLFYTATAFSGQLQPELWILTLKFVNVCTGWAGWGSYFPIRSLVCSYSWLLRGSIAPDQHLPHLEPSYRSHANFKTPNRKIEKLGTSVAYPNIFARGYPKNNTPGIP